MSEPVIVVRKLRKSYGSYEAVQGIDMQVERGQIFAFLGPNGAGKTTTVEIMEGYRDRTAGDVEVLGVDPARATADWRARIGVVLQDCRLSSLLTVRETLTQYAGYYPSPRSVGDTIALVGLGDKADARAGRLSGGQRRRLDVAVALIGDPELLFLDEPTTGFDPAARREAWEVIGGLRDLGKTVLLTTHYMDEAQHLADRVAIINEGRIVAEGGPSELGGAERKTTVVRFRLPQGTDVTALPSGVAARVVERNGLLELASDRPVADLAALCGWAVSEGVDLADLEAHRPSLEEVYLALTAEGAPVPPATERAQ